MVSNVGHGNKEVISGILDQVKELSFAHTSQFRNRPQEEYASLISEITPPALDYVYFLSGGSEANETAIKMARQYFIEKGKPSKYKVIGRWSSYHGNTLGTLSAGGHVKRRMAYTPLLIDFPHIDSPDWYRNPDADPIYYADLLEAEIKRQGEEQVAAFMLEPVTGTSNAASCSPSVYYQRIREICDQYDVLLICDEVMSGFGRTGKYFASEHFGFIPDLITGGKGISGGYAPLAAVIVKDSIFKTFFEGSGQFSHGHTYIGNPVSMQAGLMVLKYLRKYDVVEHVSEIGKYLLSELQNVKTTSDIIGDVRGLGLMIGVEFVADQENKTPFPPEAKLAEKVKKVCFENGLIVYPGSGHINGDQGDTVLIAPPFVITKEEVDELVGKFAESVNEISRDL
ncbi:aminotransferase class III-fold pyridoxal phosphate-dependent enzyme [Planococcus salinus]|uniref:Aminotransferase class III-fold pyridoxal phosphate-dependent enzyme n=1 Tax=Planococcus salinus TaxID=1848460 RepID=A0A3M8P5F8_9BACL|nr:aminotransferase class III-fold pyridoxal phosphate-dependent enzyme [Planococcus salinus]